MPSFHLSYSALMDLLASVHGMLDEDRTMLRGRLEQFQRRKFPEGANTGRGRPAQYTIPMVLQMTAAFELVQLGGTPARIIDQIGQAIRHLADGFHDALDCYPDSKDDLLYFFSERTLISRSADLSKPKSHDIRMGVVCRMSHINPDDEIIGGFFNMFTRASLINLSKIMQLVVDYIIQNNVATIEQIRADVKEWHDICHQNDDELKSMLDRMRADDQHSQT